MFVPAKGRGRALAKLKEAVKLDPSILTPEATIALYYHAAHDEKQEAIAQQWMVKALTACAAGPAFSQLPIDSFPRPIGRLTIRVFRSRGAAVRAFTIHCWAIASCFSSCAA